jgi:acid phosphatase type 7
VLPRNGQAGGVASGTEAYYAFDYANVHFIVLDSMDSSRAPGDPMLTWLHDDLAATGQEWVIAIWHHPPYSKGSHNSDNAADSGGRMIDMRETVLPILEAGGVDVVLTGHSHNYERSYLLDGAYGYGTSPNFATPSFNTLLADGRILDAGDGNPSGNGAYQKNAGGTSHNGRFMSWPATGAITFLLHWEIIRSWP